MRAGADTRPSVDRTDGETVDRSGRPAVQTAVAAAAVPSSRRRGTGRHVHIGAHTRLPTPMADDLYRPGIERRRRTTALIDGFAALGVEQTVLGASWTSLHRLPASTVHLHLNDLQDLPQALVAANVPTARSVVHLRNSADRPMRTGSRATVTSRLVGGPSERWLLRLATLVVTNSDRLAETAEDAGARHVLVVPDAPLPAPDDLPARPQRPLPERSGRRIVSVGPLVARRRSTALVEALAGLPHDVHLLLIGTGPDRLAIDQAARRLRVADRVAIIPTATHATVAAHLAHADVVASASLAGDDLPELLLAMAAGRPLVATAVEGVPRHLTAGLDGSLVTAANTPQLTRSLARLLADPPLAATLGASAGRRATSHGWDVVAARVLDALRP